MSRTKISWTQWTWNMIGGCTPVSEGCLNCAAAKSAARGFLRNNPLYKGLTKNGKYTGEIRLCTDIGRNDILEAPLHIKQPTLIFVEFMGDLFHKDVPDLFVCRVHDIIKKCPQHTFQVLTKRPDRMYDHLIQHPYPTNLHIGVSCENQKTADERIPILLQIPAAKRFVSFEPLLGEIDVTPFIEQGYNVCFNCGWYGRDKELPEHNGLPALPCPKCDEDTYAVPIDELIDQVIIGSESLGGHAGRECKLEWVRNLVAQAQAAGCKIHVKQLHLWGTKKDNAIYETAEDAKLHFGEVKVKKFLVKDINQFPEDLRLQEKL